MANDWENSIEKKEPDYIEVEAEGVEFNDKEIANIIKDKRYKDFNRIRENNISLFELAKKCAEGALIAAQETHDTNEYKIASEAIERAAKINDKVLANHEKLKQIEQSNFSKYSNQQGAVTNTVNILATTAEILKSIEERNK